MSATEQHQYRDLQRESSNFLMEHDSRRVLGRYAEAAYDALEAGRRRARMGQLCYAAGEYAEAFEDWLSAAECYLQGTGKKQAAEILSLLQRVEADSKMPATHLDLHAALREREHGLDELRQREQRFLRDLTLQGRQIDRADERTLEFLLEQVRGLPGLALLHYMIYRQASDLGRQDLAERHLVWAATFDPDNASLIALLGYLYLAHGKPQRALTVGSDYLGAHASDTGPVRIMMANAYGVGVGGRLPDQEQALAVLRPLLAGAPADECEHVAGLALSAAFQYEIGREQDYRRLLGELEYVESATQSPEVRSAIAEFRELIPHAEGNGVWTSRLLPAADRERLFNKARQLNLRPIAVAA